MATINDFKAVASRALTLYSFASKTIDPDGSKSKDLSELDKTRFGFNYLVIQAITDISDYDVISDGIVDKKFNSVFNADAHEDEGVDAIYIDDEDKQISLFNFKYREKYNADREQSLNETVLSAKYLNILITRDNTAEGKLKTKTDEIIDCLNSNDEWKISLYVVSNENKTLPITDKNLQRLKDVYGVEIIALGLDEIRSLISDRPESINAKVILPTDALMSYSESVLDSRKSYIIRLNLVDLIRMTSSDCDLRDNCNIEDASRISSSELAIGCLYDNIRGYLARSGYNKNIERTLKQSPSKFFFYNNGITIVADSIVATEINAKTKFKVEISGLQVLNGGQTLRTIHNFNRADPNNLEQYLANAEVLVRVLNVTDENEKNRIGEYTNSQNTISQADLRSTRPEQIALERYLGDHGILYVRKRGNTGDSSKTYTSNVSMPRLGQILLAQDGRPELISNKKSAIFDKQYDSLFGRPDLLSQGTVDSILAFDEITNAYRSSSYDSSEQKKLYILYIAYATNRKDYSSLIDEFEPLIDQFLQENHIGVSRSRVLIRSDFRKWVDQKFSIEGKE